MSPYGTMVVAEEGARRPTPSRPSSMAGTFVIFKGPLKDNKGKDGHRRPASSSGQTDPELEKMDYLVEGVIGATS